MSSNLRYTDIEDIQISRNSKSGGLNLENFNKSISKLLENDLNLLPDEDSDIPSIFERKWINNNNVAGYKLGDAVWLNTEDPVEFVNNNRSEIIQYILNNSILYNKYQTISADENICDQFIRKVALSGYDAVSAIYVLGDISSKTQLMVSKIDNNKNSPENTEYWYPFFETEDNESVYKQYLSCLDDIQNEMLSTHLSVYHFGNYNNDIKNIKLSSASDISALFLNDGLTNIPLSAKQQYISHEYNDVNTLSGFDSVELFISKKFNDKTTKWFRLWTSGYLEHGGIVDVKNPNTTDDSYAYNSSCYKVNLQWLYDSTNNYYSPKYDFK